MVESEWGEIWYTEGPGQETMILTWCLNEWADESPPPLADFDTGERLW